MVHADIFGLVGQQLEGRYRVDRVVGEGGFGVVYLGWHLAFQRPIALKCLKTPGHFTADARRVFVDRFREEAALLYQLNERCPHVVRVLDMGVLAHPAAGSVPYLVLEWLQGQNLREALDAWRAAGAGPLGEVAAVALLAPALEALASAHRGDAGVFVAHRDVKPENLFVLAAGGLKLLDFGIAKVMQEGDHVTLVQSRTSSGFSSFSPPYGAPEQFHPRAFGQSGPWTDVHAVGLVLAELVAGRRPLDTQDYASCFASALLPDRPTPRRLGAHVSDGFEAICARALSLDPRQRFPDAGALLAALTPWVQAGTPPLLTPAPNGRGLAPSGPGPGPGSGSGSGPGPGHAPHPPGHASPSAPTSPGPAGGAGSGAAGAAQPTGSGALAPAHSGPGGQALSYGGSGVAGFASGPVAHHSGSGVAVHSGSGAAPTHGTGQPVPAVETRFAVGTFAPQGAPVVAAPGGFTPGAMDQPATHFAVASLLPAGYAPVAGGPGSGAPGAGASGAGYVGSTTGPVMAGVTGDGAEARTAPAASRRRTGAWVALAVALGLAAVGMGVGLTWRLVTTGAAAAGSGSAGARSAAPGGSAAGPGSASASGSAWVPSSARAGASAQLARLVRIEGGSLSVTNRFMVPSYKTTVASFLLEETEVTVAAYRQCVEAGACSSDRLDWLAECNWSKTDRGTHPINCVSVLQADLYCRWADRRLPTDDEWEYAARGSQKRLYPWGNEPPGGRSCWNGVGNSAGQGYRTSTCAVGSLAGDVTPTGLRDMGGNVSELTASPDCDRVAEDRVACARTGCSFRTDRMCQLSRIHRGGNWGERGDSGLEARQRSGYPLPSKGNEHLGLRCARSL